MKTRGKRHSQRGKKKGTAASFGVALLWDALFFVNWCVLNVVMELCNALRSFLALFLCPRSLSQFAYVIAMVFSSVALWSQLWIALTSFLALRPPASFEHCKCMSHSLFSHHTAFTVFFFFWDIVVVVVHVGLVFASVIDVVVDALLVVNNGVFIVVVRCRE